MRDSLPRYISEARLRSWNDAIHDRHSTRSFQKRPVDQKTLDRFEGLLPGFSPLCKGAKGYLVRRGASKVFTGFMGVFGRVSNPSAALVMAGDVHLPGHMEAVGYLGEGIVLEATSFGLGTCWVAGLFNRELAKEKVGLEPGWKAVAVSPLGYEAKRPTLSDRALKAMSKSGLRKPLDEIVTGLPRRRWPEGLWNALEAARWAPSARNAQPWRFRVDADGVVLSADTGEVKLNSIKRLDCGIAMLHFEIGCWAAGIRGSWKLPEPGNPIIGKYRYG